MRYNITSLISTIEQLESLKTVNQRNELRNKMQSSLSDSNMIMSDAHLLNIINYLVSKENLKWIEDRLLSLNDIDCLDLCKADTKLTFSLAFVGNPETSQFELCILTNKKYYNANTAQIDKHKIDNVNRRLGSGSYKVVNSCLMVVACNNDIEVSLAARATVKIGTLQSLEHFDIKYAQLYENLKKSTTIDDVLLALSNVDNDSDTFIGMKFLRSYQEVKITHDYGDLASIDRLRLGIPFVKLGENKEAYLKLHIFDKIVTYKNLYSTKYLSKSENYDVLKVIIKQFITSLTALHAKGIIHRDLKPNNILLSRETNTGLKIIDWGFAVDVNRIIILTKNLVKLLGFSQDHYGYIDGKLLNSINLEYVYRKLLPFSGLLKNIVLQTEITLDNLNAEIKKYLPDIDPLIYLNVIGTIEYVAPEIFEMVRREYYKDNILPIITLASEINIINRSDIIANNELQANEKHDIWAAGVSIVEYCLGRRPLLTDSMTIAFIERNLWLRSMLHSNPKLRCTSKELLDLLNNNGDFVIPKPSEIEWLSLQYKYKINPKPLLFAATQPSSTTNVDAVSAATNKKQKHTLSSLLGN